MLSPESQPSRADLWLGEASTAPYLDTYRLEGMKSFVQDGVLLNSTNATTFPHCRKVVIELYFWKCSRRRSTSQVRLCLAPENHKVKTSRLVVQLLASVDATKLTRFVEASTLGSITLEM